MRLPIKQRSHESRTATRLSWDCDSAVHRVCNTHRLRALQHAALLVHGVEVHLPHASGALGEQDLVRRSPANEQRVRQQACGNKSSVRQCP